MRGRGVGRGMVGAIFANVSFRFSSFHSFRLLCLPGIAVSIMFQNHCRLNICREQMSKRLIRQRIVCAVGYTLCAPFSLKRLKFYAVMLAEVFSCFVFRLKLFLINFHFKLSSCCKLPTKIQLLRVNYVRQSLLRVSKMHFIAFSPPPDTHTHTLLLYLNDTVKCVTRFAKMSLPCTRHVAVRNVDWARKMCHLLGQGIPIAAVHCTMRSRPCGCVYCHLFVLFGVSYREEQRQKKSRNASMQPLPVAVHCHKEVVSGRANSKKNSKRA